MVRLILAAVVALFAVGGNVSAQDPAPQDEEKPAYVGRPAVWCALPDGTIHRANSTLTFRGSTYRCVATFDQNLSFAGVAWTRVPDGAQAAVAPPSTVKFSVGRSF